jgi:hypothetical protein
LKRICGIFRFHLSIFRFLSFPLSSATFAAAFCACTLFTALAAFLALPRWSFFIHSAVFVLFRHNQPLPSNLRSLQSPYLKSRLIKAGFDLSILYDSGAASVLTALASYFGHMLTAL